MSTFISGCSLLGCRACSRVSRRRGLRVAVVVVVALAAAMAIVTAVPEPASAAVSTTNGWSRPVGGVVRRPFVAPTGRYGPGHRGVDFAAVAGTIVRAAGDGRVGFAGDVAGAHHVVVEHAGDLRTGYSYLDDVRVTIGLTVRRGDVLGTTGGAVDDHHAPGDFHFSLRKGDDYLDPMLLFAPVDLSRVVRLAPLDEATLGPLVVRDPSTEARDLSGLEAIGAPAAAAVREIAAAAGRLPGKRPCTSDAPDADGTGGSGHALLVVGGIGSSWSGTGNALGLPAADLGYEKADVHSFSYAGAGAYQSEATWGSIATAALSLGVQLQQLQLDHPGREVDLVAHSQGGIVVDQFLQHVYRAGDGYPPIGTVVTLSSPHEGTPMATTSRQTDSSAVGSALHGLIADRLGLPPPNAVAVTDLAEGSDLMRHLWDHRLPDQIDFTSISAVDDVIVPNGATRVPLKGVEYALTDPAGLTADHTRVRDDPSAMRAVRLALEGKAPACTSAALRLRAGVESGFITRVEHGAGVLGGALDKLGADLLESLPG